MASDKKNGTLRFVLDPTGGVPFYRQIIMQVEMAIADGRLRAGSQLPTVRALAVDLEVNPNTVARAYSELEIRGVVNTQQGSGTFISDQEVKLDEAERKQILHRLVQSFLASASSYGFSSDDVIDHMVSLKNERGESS